MIQRLLSLSCLILFILLLAACGTTLSSPTSRSPLDSPATGNTPNTSSAIMATGDFQEYPLPQSNDGLMRPAIDHEGRIWFGEMNRNYLAVFDPRTQTFQQITPPHGASGVMGVVVASDDTIWFAEQYANYIGHYIPASKQFQVYNLPTLKTPDPSNPKNMLILPSAPQDLALDAHGNVWFTELNADALGMLDLKTGIVRQYPISSKKSILTLNPYGVTVDPQRTIWFTEASTDSIGRLDPNSGNVRIYTLPGAVDPLMEIASDAQGIIWATSFKAGLLVRLNPNTGTFTRYYAPASDHAGALYGLVVTPNDEVWITVSTENAIARLDMSTNRFIYYRIPTESSLPLGVVMAANHTVWFSEAGSNKIGMLMP